MLSLGALAVVLAYAVATAGRLAPLADAAAALGAALLAAAIAARWPLLVPWSVLSAGAAYLVGREGKAVVDGWAAVIGVLLLVAAELAGWSIAHDARIRAERSLTVRRVATLVVLTAVALLVNFLLLGMAAVAASSGVLLAAAGVCAAVAAVAIVLRLART